MASVVWASQEIEPKDMAPDGEALHDRARRARPRSMGTGARSVELEEVAQRDGLVGAVVDEARVLAVELVVVRAHGLLELVDRLGVVEVPLAAQPPLVVAARLEVVVVGLDRPGRRPRWRISVSRSMVATSMPPMRETVPGKYSSTTSSAETDGLEDLGPDVGRDRRDAHLRHRLEEALAHGLDVVLACLGRRRARRAAGRAGAGPRWSRRRGRG